MRNQYENNFQDKSRQLAQYILDNAPRGIMPRHREDLARKAGPESVNYEGGSTYVDFARGEWGKADLSVGFERKGEWRGTIDKDGNRWQEFECVAKVNWPSYGSADPQVAMARLELMREVTAFAMELNVTFNDRPTHSMVETADEIAANKEAAEARQLEAKLAALCTQAVKGLRVGGEAGVMAADHGIASGLHHFAIGEKKYVATVSTTGAFVVTRAS